jgi:hypothetical protein
MLSLLLEGVITRALHIAKQSMLAQRLKELAGAEVIVIEPKSRGRGHLYRLTAAGEDFRPLIEMQSVWGQRWFQGRLGLDDLIRPRTHQRQIDPVEIPPGRTVIRFEFRDLPKGCRGKGYWWYVIERPEVDVCLKDPGFDVDAVVGVDLAALTKLSLGYVVLNETVGQGQVAFHGNEPAITLLCRLMRLPERATLKQFRFAPFPTGGGVRETERALISA